MQHNIASNDLALKAINESFQNVFESATEACITEAPTTETPSTLPRTTETATTEAPTTEVPTTTMVESTTVPPREFLIVSRDLHCRDYCFCIIFCNSKA